MPEVAYQHPLKVPAGVAITPKSLKRYDSGFSPSLTLDEALSFFLEEVARFDAQASITLYSNYTQIDQPRLRQKQGEDSAVCCEIRLDGVQYCLICHQWGLTEQNLYALHLALRAIHNMVKWGVSDYASALQGFAISGAPLGHSPHIDDEAMISRGQWLAILRLERDATLEDANAAYRYYAKRSANSEEGLLRLNEAISAARDYFAKTGALL